MIQPSVLPVRPMTTMSQGAAPDLFTLGKLATTERNSRHGAACVFSRSRRLLATGAWYGPKDAADSFVEEADVEANGGLSACATVGVRTLLASTLDVAKAAQSLGLRVLLRAPYQSGESLQERVAMLSSYEAACNQGLQLHGVIPTAIGEAFGIDTLLFMAACRSQLSVPHVVADFARLGHRLAQMSLAFGASELMGPIVSERALRLGDNANNPAMTRKEVVLFIQAAGLTAHERHAAGRMEEVTI
jgi:hypothetical protein